MQNFLHIVFIEHKESQAQKDNEVTYLELLQNVCIRIQWREFDDPKLSPIL